MIIIHTAVSDSPCITAGGIGREDTVGAGAGGPGGPRSPDNEQ